MYDWPDPYVVQIRLSPCKNIIRIQMNDAETQLPVGGGTFRVIAAEDIVTKDGTVRYTQGQYADTIVCDENGYGGARSCIWAITPCSSRPHRTTTPPCRKI